MENKGEILIYQSQEGRTKIDVRLEEETVWLSQAQIGELFQKAKSTISEHISNVFNEGELEKNTVVRNFRTTAADGKKYDTAFYNLDVIISVGYRVKSHIGTQFRIWATQRLREYIIKGFVLDDERLKMARNNYFDELLSRIRDIRSSEKLFYRKVCDIYATSMDYDAKSDATSVFFATVQNKFHWAIHSHTAAELILLRADAAQPSMGLTNWPGERIKKEDVVIAKNYLQPGELDHLNRIVNQYLEFAELQALQRKTMYMKDWVVKLNGFLTLNDREVLNHTGKVSHDDAVHFALKEYEAYCKQIIVTEPDELDKAMKTIEQPSKGKK